MARNHSKDMTAGEPMRLILFFSLPLLCGNIFQQLYSMVDTIIVGRFIGTQALAAVGTTGPMNFLVLGFASGLTSGFSVLVAQRFGAKDEAGLRRAVASAVTLCALFTVLLTALSLITMEPLLRLIHTPDDIRGDAAVYIGIIYAGITATMLYNMLACILRALGDSRTPLYFLIISSLLNIGLDLVCIVGLSMGVAGAAAATVVSQGISGLLCFFYIKKKYPALTLSKDDFKAGRALHGKHLYIGLPMAFQFSVTAVGVIVLQGALNLFGSVKIAAYTAASKVEQLVTQPAGTFGITMANYAGQNLGADRIDRIKEGVTKCTVLTLLFAAAASALLYVFGEPLTRLFVSEPDAQTMAEIVESSMRYLRIIALFFPFLNMIFVYRNMLQGVGKSLMPLMAGVFELFARTAAAFTLPGILGYTGICLAGPFAWVAAAVPLGVTYGIEMRGMLRDWKKRTGQAAL